MGLTLTVSPQGEVQAHQQMSSPAVYLDHWALMDIAANPDNAHRLADGLKQKSGTLCLSWLNLIEFCEVTDSGTRSAVDALLRKIAPGLVFIDVEPEGVIERENDLVRGAACAGPHLDQELLKHLVLRRHPCLDPLDPIGLVEAMVEDEVIDRIRRCRADLENTLPGILFAGRTRYASDERFKRRMKAVQRGPSLQTSTRYILLESIRWLIRDRIDMTNGNNWRDLLHLVVPLAYVDLLVLDRTWAVRGVEASRRLRGAGLAGQFARVFWAGTMEDFWSALDEWTPGSGDAVGDPRG